MAIFDPIYFTGTSWFVRDGDIYVSSTGSDDTGTGEPLNPYASLQKAVDAAAAGNKIVVGNGAYDEHVNGGGKNLQIVADGEVTMDIRNGIGTAFTNMGAQALIRGLRIFNYALAADGPCIVEDSLIVSSGIANFAGRIKGTVVKDAVIEATGSTELVNCTFINVRSGAAADNKNKLTQIYDCHFDAASVFDLSAAVTQQFDYCNQEPGSQIKINGVAYATAAAVHAAYPQYQANGKSLLPQFNDPATYDYTLRAASPLLHAGRFYRFIGAAGEGSAVRSSSLLRPDLSAVYKGTDGRYRLVEDYSEGSITTKVIDLGRIRTLGRINLFAEQIFDDPSMAAVVSARLNELPPNAVTFRMRYSNSRLRILFARYQEFTWNRIPTIDTTGKGNGDPLFDFENQRFINARYLQLIITLRSPEETFFIVQENDDCLLQEDDDNIIWKY